MNLQIIDQEMAEEILVGGVNLNEERPRQALHRGA